MRLKKNLEKISVKKQPKKRDKCIRRLRQEERKVKYQAQGREDWRYLEAG